MPQVMVPGGLVHSRRITRDIEVAGRSRAPRFGGDGAPRLGGGGARRER